MLNGFFKTAWKRYRLPLACALAAVSVCVGVYADWRASAHQPRLVHIESSEFAPVVVFEEFGERCMNFNSMHEQGRQSCFDLDDPDRMVFGYTRMMTTALFVNPDPEEVLIIGLGGATLPNALHEILPETTIHTVEIDPAVVRVAQDYFAYEPGPRQRIYIEDGREFVERAHASGQRFGMIMLDAFDTDYIPPHLMTVEFFELLRDLMEPDGVLAANSFTISRMYDRESATYAAVFGDFYNLRGTMDANRVIIATKGPLPDQETLARNAATLSTTLAPYGIDTDLGLSLYTRRNTWDRNAPALRDP